ncbi:TetR family transcriptional regulator [Gilliamella sp. Pas-s95]|uniref:TetR family transcriptional regulator n=1 Tax=Gilliamella sp. Pas-s95 TaxID=2687317 RepID=UPI001921575C
MTKTNDSLRERKKIKMREELVEAAFKLFVQKGFDNTTINDIADLADVSSRTFFRYFSCKEDVVLDYQLVEYDEIITSLEFRPATESILLALRKSSVNVTKCCEEGAYGIDPNRFKTLRDLIRNHPSIRAKNNEILQSKKQLLTELIAKKLGVNHLHDMRPMILSTLLEFVYSAAYDIWKEKKDSAPFYDVLDETFVLIENGMNYPCVY